MKVNAKVAKRKIGGEAASSALPDAALRNAEDLHKLVETAAYYKAQRRGFVPGHEVEDWLDAEAEVLAGAHAVTDLAA